YPRRFSHSFYYSPSSPHPYTLSLHDALPICEGDSDGDPRVTAPADFSVYRALVIQRHRHLKWPALDPLEAVLMVACGVCIGGFRSEEHTSQLQPRENLVCRLLLEKKKKKIVT